MVRAIKSYSADMKDQDSAANSKLFLEWLLCEVKVLTITLVAVSQMF